MYRERVKKVLIVLRFLNKFATIIRKIRLKRAIVIIQSKVRCIIARKELKKLRIEAKSVAGIETKFKELQTKYNKLLNEKTVSSDNIRKMSVGRINLTSPQSSVSDLSSVGDLSDLAVVAVEQKVELSTYQVMQAAFVGQLGAFSYLLFILLYTPCVAAMGAIKNEVGTRWAGFAASWSFLLAYLMATLCFQVGNFLVTPFISSIYIVAVFIGFAGVYWQCSTWL